MFNCTVDVTKTTNNSTYAHVVSIHIFNMNTVAKALGFESNTPLGMSPRTDTAQRIQWYICAGSCLLVNPQLLQVCHYIFVQKWEACLTSMISDAPEEDGLAVNVTATYVQASKQPKPSRLRLPVIPTEVARRNSLDIHIHLLSKPLPTTMEEPLSVSGVAGQLFICANAHQ